MTHNSRPRCFAVTVMLMALPWALIGCAMSEEQEIQIGREMHPQFEQEFGGIYPDERVQQYVQSVGMDMARYAGRENLDWQFRVLNSDQINAFAVPGGYIYLTQGLLYQLENEAQLAGVLGHEAGHIAHRHSVKQIQQAQGWQIGGAIAGIFGGQIIGDIGAIVGTLAVMRYGRGQEREADMSGLKYMTAGGYAPQGMVRTMEILREASSGRNPPEFLSTHPDPGNRAEYLTETIQERYMQPAETGRFGDREFEQNVLSRRPRADGSKSGGVAHASWCATCGRK